MPRPDLGRHMVGTRAAWNNRANLLGRANRAQQTGLGKRSPSRRMIARMSPLLDLDGPCGRHLAFRDLIECGETWHDARDSGTPIPNLPLRPESVAAMACLCETVLDPVIDQFGPITLTYGFTGPTLSRRAAVRVGRVAPAVDQHAACEVNRNGRQICERGGAAVDFLVDGTSTSDLAKWIVTNTDFDRLYYYGPSKPLHVSASTEPVGKIVLLERREPGGRAVPRNVRADRFLRDF